MNNYPCPLSCGLEFDTFEEAIAHGDAAHDATLEAMKDRAMQFIYNTRKGEDALKSQGLSPLVILSPASKPSEKTLSKEFSFRNSTTAGYDPINKSYFIRVADTWTFGTMAMLEAQGYKVTPIRGFEFVMIKARK